MFGYIEFCKSSPGAAVLITALAALIIQLLIDAWLGHVAEYFNAWYLIKAIGLWVTGQPYGEVPFLIGQEKLGVISLPVGTLVLLVQPFLYGALLVGAARLIAPLIRGG
ncbi:hypothetical protein [Sneathiella limimaris]|uniref:hypothetical protein n=1 Tax=Sneathiella limimaris TaxID=1964213 RepID=UPI00146B074E|nr:hypothetical protein [Sneathiella limimaris]